MWTRHGTAWILLAIGMASSMAAVGVHSTQANDASPGPAAVLDETAIALGSISLYHCHDLGWPVIRCFHTAGERDLDVLRAADERTNDSSPYVTVFEDEGYGGGSLTFSSGQTNLTAIGWNDVITSFKSLNGGHPKFWDNANFIGTPAWQWTAGAWVANVGSGANDKISSFKNVP